MAVMSPQSCPQNGITGQDGSYLVELSEKSYAVHGIKRRASSLTQPE